MDEKERIIQLRKELHEHNYKYYVLNQPTIGDQEFDFMMHELQDLEAKHPEMADENSPTQRVGSDLNEEFRQVEHKYPMLSLANTYNEQDVSDWYDDIKSFINKLRSFSFLTFIMSITIFFHTKIPSFLRNFLSRFLIR